MSAPIPAPSGDVGKNQSSPLLPPSAADQGVAQPVARIPREDAIPIFTDEVDEFWEFEDRDSNEKPGSNPKQQA
jgi:hypothetical protein